MGRYYDKNNPPKGQNNKPKGETMYHKTTILGRIGSIYDSTTTPSGTTIGTMSVAVSEKYKGEEKTNWYRVKMFNKTVDTINQYTGVGCRVLIEGKMEFGSYTKQDGTKVNTAELIANSVQIIDFKEKQEASQAAPTQEFDPDSIPF